MITSPERRNCSSALPAILNKHRHILEQSPKFSVQFLLLQSDLSHTQLTPSCQSHRHTQAPLRRLEHPHGRDVSKAKAFNKSWDWLQNSLAGSRALLQGRAAVLPCLWLQNHSAHTAAPTKGRGKNQYGKVVFSSDAKQQKMKFCGAF